MSIETSVTYDNDTLEVLSVYWTFARGKVYRTHGIDDWTNIDVDKKGRVLGIEMLEPGRVTQAMLRKAAKKFNEPRLTLLRPKNAAAMVAG